MVDELRRLLQAGTLLRIKEKKKGRKTGKNLQFPERITKFQHSQHPSDRDSPHLCPLHLPEKPEVFNDYFPDESKNSHPIIGSPVSQDNSICTQTRSCSWDQTS